MRGAIVTLRAEWDRRWHFDGRPKNLLTAAASVAVATGVGLAVNQFTDHQWYAAPFVCLVGVIANRLGMRSALLASVLSAVALDYLFLPERLSWGTRAIGYVSMLAAAVLIARPRPPSGTRVYDNGPNLPFTGRNPNGNGGGLHSKGWVYWDVRPSGKWAEDCRVGSEYFRIWLARATSAEHYPMLSWVLHDMIRSGRWSGVEAGFASGLERAATRLPLPASPHHEERHQQSED